MIYGTLSPGDSHHFKPGSILGQLDAAAVNLILARASRLNSPKGKVIVEEGIGNTDLYFVLAGMVRASYITKDGKEISLADIGPGNCFGEFSVIDNRPTSASVMATQHCQLAVVNQRDFIRLLAESQALVHVFMRHLIAIIRRRTIRIIEFSSLPVSHRVRAELLRLSTPLPEDANVGVIDHPPSQSELANFISSHREAVAREMAELARSALIAKNNRNITIPSLSKLRASIIGGLEIS